MNSHSAGARGTSWYHGWNVVGGSFAALFVAIGMTICSLTLFLVPWSQEFNVPISQILLAMIPTIIVSGLISPPLGALADKYPARWIFGAGLVGMALGFIAMSRISAVWHIWALYTWFPIPACMCGILPASALISRWFVKRAALALGLMAFGKGVAGMAVPLAVGWALPEIGWRGAWLWAGILTLVAAPLVLWPLRDRPDARDGFAYVGAPGAGGHGDRHAVSTLGWGDIMRSRNFWLIVVFFLPMLSVFLGVQQNLAPIATRLGLAPSAASSLVAAYSLSHAIATLVASVVSDRIGNRQAMAGLALFAATGATVVAFGQSFPVLVTGAVMVGAAGALWPLLPVAAAEEFGSSGVGRAFGAIMLLSMLSAAVPAIIARVEEATGSYTPAMLTLAGACVISALAAIAFRVGDRKDAPIPALA